MFRRSHRRRDLVVLTLPALALACTAPRTPIETAPTTAPTSPATAALPPPRLPSALPSALTPPTPPPDRTATRAQLARAEAQYFDGEHRAALEGFLAAWEAWHPNPLALAMAGHAARQLGESARATALYREARAEAEAQGAGDCEERAATLTYFDRPGAAWLLRGARWERVDLRQGRVLYGFCGGTRDPAVRAGALTWAPPVVEPRWDEPPPGPDGTSLGTHISLVDRVYGDEVGRLEHHVGHIFFNEGYHGSLALSADRAILASASDVEAEGIRIWRTADGTLLRQLPPAGSHWLALSADGTLLLAGTCTTLTLWDTTTGVRLHDLTPPYLTCGYGAGIGAPVFGTAFSPDGAELAVGVMVMSFPAAPIPTDDAGSFLFRFRVRDGRLLGKWRESLAPRGFAPAAGALYVSPFFGDQLLRFNPVTGRSAELGCHGEISPDGGWILDEGGEVCQWQGTTGARPVGGDPRLEPIGWYALP